MRGVPRLCRIALDHRLIERYAENTLKSLQRDEAVASTQDEWPIPGSGGEAQCAVKFNLKWWRYHRCRSPNRRG
jgi:hypothetical protein